jgi:acetate kinase
MYNKDNKQRSIVMSLILSVNAGSSSLKFQLLAMPEESVVASGLIEKISLPDSAFTLKFNNQKKEIISPIKDHQAAIKLLLNSLIEYKLISDYNEISGIGHRIVHGGEKYSDSVLVTDTVIDDIAKFSILAPLHNPANLLGITSFKKILPNVKQVAVFDTAFHQTMSPVTYLYGLPYDYYSQLQIRKYGFHGTSHRFLTQKAHILLKNPAEYNIITLHLGNGSSLCAIKNGLSIDTSMGFTPLAGVLMGTRSGDIDPAIIQYICQQKKMSIDEVTTFLNKECGFLGVSGVSSDCREIQKAIVSGNPKAKLALEMFIKSVVDYIGSYYLKLQKVDAIVFSGGIGENDGEIRAMILDQLAIPLNISYDPVANKVRGKEAIISKPDSKIKVFVIPTNEELMIAKDTIRVGKIK